MIKHTVIAEKSIGDASYSLVLPVANLKSQAMGCKACVCEKGALQHTMEGSQLCSALGATCVDSRDSYWIKNKRAVNKFYAGRLFERNGEYEYNITVFFKLKGKKSPEKHLNDWAKNQYSGSKRKERDGWYFNGDEVYVEAQGFHEISESTYNEMTKLGY